jgi:hypothetical protein
VGHRASLNGCGKSLLHRDSITGPSIPERVTIRTELSRHAIRVYLFFNINARPSAKTGSWPMYTHTGTVYCARAIDSDNFLMLELLK